MTNINKKINKAVALDQFNEAIEIIESEVANYFNDYSKEVLEEAQEIMLGYIKYPKLPLNKPLAKCKTAAEVKKWACKFFDMSLEELNDRFFNEE